MQASRTLRSTLIVLAVATLAYFVANNWQETLNIARRIESDLFVTSLLAGFLAAVVLAYLFHLELKSAGCTPPVPIGKSMGLFFTSQVIKYIPGKVWPLVYQSAALGGWRGTSCVLKANYGLMVLSMSAMLLVASACTVAIMPFVSMALAIAATGMVLLGNAILRLGLRLANQVRSKREVPIVSELPRLTSAHAVTILPFVILNAIAYILLFQSLEMGFHDAVRYTAYISIAWVAGALIFIMPAGLGVREAVFVALGGLLGDTSTLSEQFGIAIVARFWQVLLDISGITVFYCLQLIYRLTKNWDFNV